MILSGQSILHALPLHPILLTKHKGPGGVSYGLSEAGYDIRIKESVLLWPGRFVLASSVELFNMPTNILGIVHDKSTWARLGAAVQNTVIEPGWKGYLTLEITMHAFRFLRIPAGAGIAQIIFHRLDQPAVPYNGKYQNQPSRPIAAIRE